MTSRHSSTLWSELLKGTTRAISIVSRGRSAFGSLVAEPPNGARQPYSGSSSIDSSRPAPHTQTLMESGVVLSNVRRSPMTPTYDATITAVISIIVADARCDHTGQPQLFNRVTYIPFKFRKCHCSFEKPSVFLLPSDPRSCCNCRRCCISSTRKKSSVVEP